MSKALPPYFYKYLSVSGATAVLSNQTLRWATPITFNDPSDMQVDLVVRADRDVVIEKALDLMWARCCGKAPPAANRIGSTIDEHVKRFASLGESAMRRAFRPGLEKAIEELPRRVRDFSAEIRPEMSKTKLICFSELHDSNLMWSHYAESHTGLVLQFRIAEGCDSVYQLAKPVIYSADPPEFSDDETLAKILAGDQTISFSDFERMAFTKSAEWSYEREWRIQSGNGRRPDEAVEYAGFFTEELSAVYFGCRASPGTKNLLSPLISHRYPSAKIYHAKREPSSYVLHFEAD